MTPEETGGLLSLESIEEMLNAKVTLFNEQVPAEPKFAKFVEGMERKVYIQLGDSIGYTSQLANSFLDPLQRIEGPPGFEPDITLAMDQATLSGMLNDELSPVKAYAMKRLKVKAQVKDLLMLKKLLATP